MFRRSQRTTFTSPPIAANVWLPNMYTGSVQPHAMRSTRPENGKKGPKWKWRLKKSGHWMEILSHISQVCLCIIISFCQWECFSDDLSANMIIYLLQWFLSTNFMNFEHISGYGRRNTLSAASRTLLIYFAKMAPKSNKETVDYSFLCSLLQSGACVDVCDRHGQTVLHEVKRKGYSFLLICSSKVYMLLIRIPDWYLFSWVFIFVRIRFCEDFMTRRLQTINLCDLLLIFYFRIL